LKSCWLAKFIWVRRKKEKKKKENLKAKINGTTNPAVPINENKIEKNEGILSTISGITSYIAVWLANNAQAGFILFFLFKKKLKSQINK